MKSLAKKVVASAHNKLGRINDLLNGPDPRFVSYRENGKDKKIEKLDLNSEHCHSYIGKMKIDGTGTYSDEVITALIKYFFDNTKKDEKVVIELANKVSELLNGDKSMEDHMDFEQQKQHILELAKGLNKKRTKDLDIIDIQDSNKRLFDVLENQGIEELKGGKLPDFNKNFDSLDIARYLYSVAQQDPEYFIEIKGLKSESFKGENKNSDYYGLIEIAIRINDLLHGITLQGGVARQKKYDALLLKHINPYIKDFPLLNKFKQACWDYLKGASFRGLYFDTEESEKYLNKIDKKDLLKNKTRNALLLTLGLTIGIGATYFSSNYFDRKKQKAITEETIKDIFENRMVSEWGDMFGIEYKTPEEKLEQINYHKDKIIEDFVIRFGGYGRLTKQQFENLVIGCMSDQKALNILADANDMSKYNKIMDKFLLSPQNKGILIHSGVNITPYKRYQKYENIFENTINMPENIKNKELFIDELTKKAGFTDHIPKQIGGYVKLDGRGNAIGIVKIKNQQYIVSGGTIYEGEIPKIEDKDRSINQGINIAYDYFLQTKPIISTIIDEVTLRYCGAEELNIFNSDFTRMKNEIKQNIKEKIIKYIVNSKLYDIDKNDFAKIMEIADNFVLENKDFLDKKFSLEPYSYFDQYKNAFENSLKKDFIEKSFRSKNHPFRIKEGDSSYETKYIGKYRDKKGKAYGLLVVYIEDKPYIFAEDFENHRRKGEYYIVLGEEIAKDFLEIRNK